MQMKESKRGDVHRVLNRCLLVNDKGRRQGFVFWRTFEPGIVIVPDVVPRIPEEDEDDEG